MRIKIQTKAERIAAFDYWEKWFAWHPIEVDGAILWLTYVERIRSRIIPDTYDYREIKANC